MKEGLFSILLFSILFKVVFALYGITLPVNFSLIILPFFLFFMLFYIAKQNFHLKTPSNLLILGLLLLFWAWMLMSSLYSISEKYKFIKSSLFLLNILLFAYPMWVPLNYKRLFVQMVTIATILEPILFVFIPLLLFGDVEGSKAYYLALGEISGIIILFYLVLIKNNQIKPTAFSIIVILIHTIILLMNPARGPIIFTLILITIWAFFHFDLFLRLKMLIFILVSFVCVTGILIVFFSMFPEYSTFLLERMGKLIQLVVGQDVTIMGVSTYERLVFWAFSIKMIFKDAFHFLFGYGIGSFGTLFNGYDGRLYPHNMILETWFELGLIGIIILGLFFTSYILEIARKRNIWLLLPLGVPFLDAMKSFSLPDLRILFGIMGMVLNFVIWNKRSDIDEDRAG